MSRRIYVLAAIAALVVTPASADRECFEDACSIPERMPGVTEPPAAVPTPEVEAVPEAPAKERAVATTRIRPQMVVDPATRPPVPAVQVQIPVPVPVEPRYSADAGPQNYERREPLRPALRPAEEREVYGVNQGPAPAPAASSPAYVVNQGPTYGVALPVPPSPYEVAMVHPYAEPDAVGRRCQSDARGRRNTRCVPPSYQPYGPGGYRPMGTYQPYRAPGVVMTAPDARIIVIESDD
jgi:hypothetical protein